MRRKIGIVTGGRADYGLLVSTIDAVHNDQALELQLFVTGMHLDDAFGNTVSVIEKDGYPIAARVPMLEGTDTALGTAQSTAKGMDQFASVFSEKRPDILLVLGDRFEILSAVLAAYFLGIPVAHIHGGEVTEGAFDDGIRHAMTKLSSLHFVSTSVYRDRILRMGEQPANVFQVGAPGLDLIRRIQYLDRQALEQALNFPLIAPVAVCTYNPVTLARTPIQAQIEALFGALEMRDDLRIIFTLPNADPGTNDIQAAIKSFVKKFPGRSIAFTSLGAQRYLSLLRVADLMIGNSSSGIAEAPSFGLPVVNIGDRQKGRIRAENVIDVVEKKQAILTGIEQAIARGRMTMENPFGDGKSGAKIVAILKSISIDSLKVKVFYDG